MWTTQAALVLILGAVLASARVKEFKIESIDISPGSEEVFTFTHTMTQVNASTISLSGEYELKQELDNTWTIQFIASLVTRGNAFFEVYRTKPQGVCDAVKTAGSAAMMDIPDLCPVPAESGAFEEQLINFEPIMKSGIAGRMKMDVILAQGGKEKARVSIVVAGK